MAAVAATGLTCCGGGGGGDESFEGLTIEYYAITDAGSMWVTIQNASSPTSSYATVQFGSNHGAKNEGQFNSSNLPPVTSSGDPVDIPDNLPTDKRVAYVEVSIDSYAEPNGQDEATGFYSNITGINAGAEGGNNGEGEVDYAFPKTWITMVYDSDSSGQLILHSM